MPFPKEKNIFPLWKYLLPPKWKGPKLLIKISAEIRTMHSTQVIIWGVWLEFLQNKGALEPTKEEIKEILWAGFRESYYRGWFCFFSLCCLQTSLSRQLFSYSQSIRLPAQCCVQWTLPGTRMPMALDGCQSAADNISHRKKGYFSHSFSLCQTWIEFHGTQKSIHLCPLGLFPC